MLEGHHDEDFEGGARSRKHSKREAVGRTDITHSTDASAACSQWCLRSFSQVLFDGVKHYHS